MANEENNKSSEEPTSPENPFPQNQEAHGIRDDMVVESDGDEAIIKAVRRHGPWVLFVVLCVSVFLGWGASEESQNKELREEGTKELREALAGFQENPSGTRKALEKLANDPKFNDQPIMPWVKWLIVRTHIEEAQLKLTTSGAPPEDALAKVESFLSAYSSHKELGPLAWLAKSALLEDLGRSAESRLALEKASSQSQSTAATIAQLLQSGAQKRQELWQNFKNRLNP